MYFRNLCFNEYFTTPFTAIWNLPSIHTLMYLQNICSTECIIKHNAGVCTFHSIYPKLKKRWLILLAWKVVKTLWNVSYTSVTQILYQKTCVLYQVPLNFWNHITSKDVTVCRSLEEFYTLLFIKLLLFTMVQDPWRTGYHSRAGMYPFIS